jgi:hypothetical protein
VIAFSDSTGHSSIERRELLAEGGCHEPRPYRGCCVERHGTRLRLGCDVARIVRLVVELGRLRSRQRSDHSCQPLMVSAPGWLGVATSSNVWSSLTCALLMNRPTAVWGG